MATLDQIAQHYGVCTRTVRRDISAGQLRAHKFGKAVRIRWSDAEQWAASKVVPNARTRVR